MLSRGVEGRQSPEGRSGSRVWTHLYQAVDQSQRPSTEKIHITFGGGYNQAFPARIQQRQMVDEDPASCGNRLSGRQVAIRDLTDLCIAIQILTEEVGRHQNYLSRRHLNGPGRRERMEPPTAQRVVSGDSLTSPDHGTGLSPGWLVVTF